MKMKKFIKEWLPSWCILPLLCIVAFNSVVYWGSTILTAGRPHFDFTMEIDRMVPLLPGFSWIYVLAFPFWGANYIFSARRGKDFFYRFVAADLTIHAICLLIFVIVPTTNVRPELTGDGLSVRLLQALYDWDGGEHPYNLFPSIHCYSSWMCIYSVKGQKDIPVWYQRFSVAFAVLVVISTQVLKQHYWVDAAAAILLVEFFYRFYQKGQRQRIFQSVFENWNRKLHLDS